MNSNKKKKLIRFCIVAAIDIILAALIAYWRFTEPPYGLSEISLFYALSDGLFVVGFVNFAFGLLVWISITGFFDIFAYGCKAALYFFVPRSLLERMKGGAEKPKDFYEYKVKKAEKRKDSTVPLEPLWVGGIMILLAIVCYLFI